MRHRFDDWPGRSFRNEERTPGRNPRLIRLSPLRKDMFNLDIPTIIERVIVLLIAFTVHELAHAVTADYLGDPTPRRMGRITLNPLKHLDPFGTIMLIIAGFGWAKPVMTNPMNMRGNPHTSMAIVAFAGPLSNLVMAGIAAILPVVRSDPTS